MHFHKEIPQEGVVHIVAGQELDATSQKAVGEFELDIEYAHENHIARFLDLVAPQDHIVLFDISNVTYVDSAGLWFFFDLYKQVTNQGKRFAIIGTNTDTQRVMDITKISTKIKSFESVKTALNSILPKRGAQ